MPAFPATAPPPAPPPAPSPARSGHLVYSTEGGRMCPHCRRPVQLCSCTAPQPLPPAGDGTVRVARQTQGRKGKAVTVITGLPLTADALAALARSLKAACGSGGTVKDGVIEVQGEHRDRIVALLLQAGWRVKRAGA